MKTICCKCIHILDTILVVDDKDHVMGCFSEGTIPFLTGVQCILYQLPIADIAHERPHPGGIPRHIMDNHRPKFHGEDTSILSFVFFFIDVGISSAQDLFLNNFRFHGMPFWGCQVLVG